MFCVRLNMAHIFVVLIKLVNIETVMSPCVLLSGWPVKVVETKAEEAGREEGVGQG